MLFKTKNDMNHPKGYLIAIGGAENKSKEEEIKDPGKNADFFAEGILKRVLDTACKKGDARIELITTASSVPDEQAQVYKKAFKNLGCNDVGHLKIMDREEA